MKRLILILLCWPTWVGATTYTVGTGGDFATWGDVTWGSINAGDVLDGQGETFNERIDVGADGSSGNPIVLQNFTLDGQDTLATVLTFYDSAAADYITVKDATLKNATGHGVNFSPTVTSSSHNGIRFERVVSSGHGDNCYKLGDVTGGGGMPSVVLIDVEARDCGNAGIAISNSANAYLLRPIVHTAGIDGGNLDGIALDDGTEGAQVWLPKVYNQRAGQAIDFQDSSGSAANLLVGAWVEMATDLTTIDGIGLTGSSPTTVVGSIVIGGRDAYVSKSTAGHQIFNSVAYEPTQYGVRSGNSTLNGSLKLRNFVVVRPGGKCAWVRNDAGTSIDPDYNRCLTSLGQPYTYKGTSYTLAGWRTQTSGAANSDVLEQNAAVFMKSDPAIADDFKLPASSVLRGAGEYQGSYQDHGNRRFKFPPSIGAWEAAGGDAATSRTAAEARTARD